MKSTEDLAQGIIERLEEFRERNGSNEPKDLPKSTVNKNETDADYPTRHNLPKDMGWANAAIVSGTGGGKVL